MIFLGPCGGKSTALTFLSDRLSNLGYRVYNVTEMATLLFLGGAKFSPNMSKNELLTFEASLIKSQLALEDGFYEIAKSTGKKSIVICDRGAMVKKKKFSNFDIFLLERMQLHTWSKILILN